MQEHVRAALIKYGIPVPDETRFTVLCRWRPSKGEWKLRGSHWRDLAIVVDSTGDHNYTAGDTCLFLISNNRGTAVAHHVIGPDKELLRIRENIHYNWSWYDGVVTWGVDVVSSPDLIDCWEVRG